MSNLNTIETEEFGSIELIGAQTPYQIPVIVEKSVIQRLAALLPSASYRKIKKTFMNQVEQTHTTKELVELLQDELSFQLSVNQLNEASPKLVGKIDLSNAH